MKTILLTLVGLLVMTSGAGADWDASQPHKWLQMPDLTPLGLDVHASYELILADDFECKETGPLTGIHIWGSWYHDILPNDVDPNAVDFHLSIHRDIPADESPTGYSMPGAVLWDRLFTPADFVSQIWLSDIQEGWMQPPDGYEFPGDTVCWQYNFVIPATDAFVQQGTPTAPVVYWLDVKAIPHDGTARFGWKTSTDHWNDDAVWGQGNEPFLGPWNELRYPPGHEQQGQSIDLAFVLASEPLLMDFGDAPDFPGALGYPTVLTSNGARHVITPNLTLGNLIDDETDGQPSFDALGDDIATLDDEDGVIFLSAVELGGTVTIEVFASAASLLDAWVDWDSNGVWSDPNDQVFASQTLNAGLNPLSFAVPSTAVIGDTYVRFRLSTAGGLPFDGPAPDGEVEDYLIAIVDDQQTYKWEQEPDLTSTGIDVNASYQNILADDFRCTESGDIVGIRVWGSWLNDLLPAQGNPEAVIFTLSLHADIPADESPTGYSMPGDVLWLSQFSPGTYQASIWARSIAEGWLDPPDQYSFPADWTCWVYDFPVPRGEAFRQQVGTIYWLDVKAVPVDGAGSFGWKTSLEHWNDDAVWVQGDEPYIGDWNELRYPPEHPMAGESIDLAFALINEPLPPELDFGDAPDSPLAPGYPTLLGNNGANHVIVPGFHLGISVDSEPNGQPDASALGDDTDGNDDEDGVAFTNVLRPGIIGYIDVTASAPGRLDAWLDFDGSGSWEPTEQIFTSEPLALGVNALTFNVPATATPGLTFLRSRFSTAGGLPVDGPAPDGEVEDEIIRIAEKYVLKWIQRPDLSTLGIDVNASTQAEYILADDYLCTQTLPLTDFHVWGSWVNDQLPFGEDPAAVSFTLSVHKDIPADQSPTDYSMPGEVLWLHTFGPGEFEVEPYAVDINEGWMDPPDQYFFPADHICWIYRFHVNPHEAFLQEGTQDDPIVYWIDVQARPEDPDALFGWKTSEEHWNDDAVWGQGFEPYLGPWGELRYPLGHELELQSIDLAFAIYSDLVTEAPETEIPQRTQLHQNVPNPFNPRTEIAYELSVDSHANIVIYDVRGRQVRTLVDETKLAGPYTVEWDGRDDGGQDLPSGVYFYRLLAIGCDESLKMLLLR